MSIITSSHYCIQEVQADQMFLEEDTPKCKKVSVCSPIEQALLNSEDICKENGLFCG